MVRKRKDEKSKAGTSLLRLLLAILMAPYLITGTLPSQAAPVAEQNSVTSFDLLQSIDQSTWDPVPSNLVDGFTMTLDPTVPYYYLNVEDLVADPALKVDYHPFYITTYPAGFFEYWANRNVCATCTGTWEPTMWEIINGRQPIFFLNVMSGPTFMLVDGLTRLLGGGDQNLRVDGTYLPGDYTFTGTITDTNGTSSELPVDITFILIQHQLNVSNYGTGSGTVTSIPPGIDCGITCTHSYDYSTVVTLTATANTGSTFTGWSGDVISSTNPITITMDAGKTVTATFTLNEYSLNVNTVGNGSVSKLPDQPSYHYGDVITLTATADPGWRFSSWSGDLSGSSSPITITIDTSKTVTATFTLQHQLSVSKTGTGSGTVLSNPVGIDCGTNCANNFDANTVVTLTATADTGSVFTGWNGAGCSGTDTCVVTMNAAQSVTATFTLLYLLTVNQSGTGAGTVTSIPPGIDCGITCTHYYDFNTLVTLSAVATQGSTFTGWSGEGCSGIGTCPATMSAARTVTATFTLNKYTLTVNKSGTGFGTVTSVPAGIDCGATCLHDFDYNTVVTLTATAATGSAFTGWSGAGCTGAGACKVTMSTARSVTATFTLKKYKLSVSTTGSGTVHSDPSGIDCGATCKYDFDYNTVVTLTATPASGWGFFGWVVSDTIPITITTNPVMITMTGPKSIKAVFKQYSVFLPTVRLDPVFADDFNYPSELVSIKWEIVPDPSIPQDQNATWTTSSGEFHGRHAVADHNSKAAAKVYSPQMPGSYSVVANIKLASGSVDGGRGGVLFDFKDNTRTYRFVIMPGVTSGDNWLVQKLVSGSWIVISDGHGRATNMLPRDQYNLLRVERWLDGSIKVYLNNVLLWSGNDLTYQYGRAGLNIGTPVSLGTGEYVEIIFDDFVIDSLP